MVNLDQESLSVCTIVSAMLLNMINPELEN